MTSKLLVLPGDGIGQEIVGEAVKMIKLLQSDYGLNVEMEEALIGGTAYDATGKPLPDETLRLAKESDAVLLGAVGGYRELNQYTDLGGSLTVFALPGN